MRANRCINICGKVFLFESHMHMHACQEIFFFFFFFGEVLVFAVITCTYMRANRFAYTYFRQDTYVYLINFFQDTESSSTTFAKKRSDAFVFDFRAGKRNHNNEKSETIPSSLHRTNLAILGAK